MKNQLFLLLLFQAIGICRAQTPTKLQFNKPAEFFEETLVLGNGKMGASIFGNVNADKLFLNDITLWAGEPGDANMNPEAYKNLPTTQFKQ